MTLKNIMKALIAEVITQIFVYVFGVAISSGIVYAVAESLQKPIPTWFALLIGVVFVLCIALFKIKKTNRFPIVGVRRRRGDELEEYFDYYGVKWKGAFPRIAPAILQVDLNDEQVWIEGPYCPNCMCAIKTRGKLFKAWHCENCGKKTKRPNKSDDEIREQVRDRLLAEVFRKPKAGIT